MKRLLFIFMLAASAVSAKPALFALADPDVENARKHFDRAMSAYDAGKYTEAIAEFEAAKVIHKSALLDFDIARCEDRLENWTAAADAYERYLASLLPGKEADDIRERIAVLRARAAPHPTLVTSPVVTPLVKPVAPPATRSPPMSRLRVAALGVGVGVVLSLAAAIAAGVVANSEYSGLEQQCGGFTCGPGVTDFSSSVSAGRTAGIGSDVMLGVGIASAVGGGVLFVKDKINGGGR